ncbi:MAG TPA: bacillolysin, partial [Runella sp.]|nr:bacillolysin [Runella sp.]
GHEFTHGLVSYTANLLGQSESGALNEGIADMLGTAVEHWAQVKTPDWLIASEVILGGI